MPDGPQKSSSNPAIKTLNKIRRFFSFGHRLNPVTFKTSMLTSQSNGFQDWPVAPSLPAPILGFHRLQLPDIQRTNTRSIAMSTELLRLQRSILGVRSKPSPPQPVRFGLRARNFGSRPQPNTKLIPASSPAPVLALDPDRGRQKRPTAQVLREALPILVLDIALRSRRHSRMRLLHSVSQIP